MAFERCDPPRPHELAVSNPADTIKDHAEALGRQHSYWAREKSSAENDVELGRHVLAHTLTTQLWQAGEHYWESRLVPEAISSETAERHRIHALGALALSLMAGSMWRQPDVLLTDSQAYAEQSATMILDVYEDKTGSLPPRVHVLREASDHLLPPSEAADQWYRQGILYVRRTIPAEPSEPLGFAMQIMGYTADFPNMTSLYPYVASRHAEE